MEEIPENILFEVRKRSTKNQSSRFPNRLKILLDWVGRDPDRGKIAGCGWKSSTTFFMDKTVLCSVLDVKQNTLNVNLKELGFEQCEAKKGNLTFWRNPLFTEESQREDVFKIKNITKNIVDPNDGFHIEGVFATLLDDIRLFGMSERETSLFKRLVIEMWLNLLQSRVLFAISLREFTDVLEEKVGLSADNYSLLEALHTKIPDVIDINDFAVFLARFGPFDNIIFKLGKLQQVIPDLRLESTQFGTISSFFSNTFDNCFSFQCQGGEYHCYNLPNIGSSSNYIINEDGEQFQSWQMALMNTNLLQNQMPFYNYM